MVGMYKVFGAPLHQAAPTLEAHSPPASSLVSYAEFAELVEVWAPVPYG